ncbi:MAG: nucleotide exchange factor GrpE [Thermodesulfobacteriota bacterium]
MADAEVNRNEEAEDKKKISSEETRGEQEKQKSIEEMTQQELIERVKDAEQKAQESYDLYMRAYAEMDNIKKRRAKDRVELAKFANESLIKQLLPVIDSLDKALEHGREGGSLPELVEGLEMTRKVMMDTLEKAGLSEVEAESKPFDPNFHEAISKQPDDTVPPNHVITEMQKGYVLNGRLIRPSVVVISQGDGETTENNADHT